MRASVYALPPAQHQQLHRNRLQLMLHARVQHLNGGQDLHPAHLQNCGYVSRRSLVLEGVVGNFEVIEGGAGHELAELVAESLCGDAYFIWVP